MRGKYILLQALVALLLLSMLACQPSATSGKKSIVVTYSILGSLVREMVGDKATVTVATPNGVDPHEWAPSAKDIETINKADFVIENGLGLEGGMEKTLEAARQRGVKFFRAADYIQVRYVGPGEGIPSEDPDQQVGAADPHLWMDPLAMKSIVGALSTELMTNFQIDIAARSLELENRLDNLNQETADSLSIIPPQNRKLVTGHESMGYYAQRYGFKLAGVIVPSLSTQAEVSAADLAALKKSIQDEKVKVIFTELGTSPAVAKAIGDETGVRVVEIAPVTLPGDGSYFTFMKKITGAIVSALK